MKISANLIFFGKILFSLSLAYTLSYGLRTVSAVMAPILKNQFTFSDSQLGLLSATYFITFCIMQLPLGPLLDKYGTRKVEAILLFIAGLGAIIFAISNSFWGLMLGRLLIGMGVSACLMGAFKVFREIYDLSHQGSLAMFMMFFGTMGALLSSAPTQYLMDNINWRNIFLGISGFLFLSGFLVFVNIPNSKSNKDINDTKQDINISLKSYLPILKVPIFWQSAPVFLIIVGSFLSIQSLWCGPWFVEVAKMSPAHAAKIIMYMNISQLIAYALIGIFIAPWFTKRGKLLLLVKTSYVLALSFLLIGLMYPVAFGAIGFIIFCFFYSSNTLSYTVVNEQYPAHMVARSSTAGNFIFFIGAFLIQWAMGAYIDLRVNADLFAMPLSRSEALAEAMWINVLVMLLSLIWYLFSGKSLSVKIAKYF